MRKRWRGGLAAVVLALAGTACGTADSAINERCLVYTGGLTEDKKFKGFLEPGATFESVGYGSKDYCYRTDQRSYIGSAEQGKGDTGPTPIVSQDDVRMIAEYQLYFKLNLDDEVFRAFHENLGVKTQAWGDDGWRQMLREYFEPQIDRALESAALLHNWRDLYASEDARAAFNRDTVRILRDNIGAVIGGNYFCGPSYAGPGSPCGDFTFTVGKPRPENGDLAAAIESQQVAQARLDAQATENRRIAAQVDGERQLVGLYGPDNAVLLEAIRSGKVQTFVVDAADGTTTPAR
jgi:hypothetical protein